ncbi:conjugative relaxase domain protein, TrwC/TraI family [filamentous cyanobacterium CCT1]|nr:conjugative relaxase domain protein, TrwC/TraI family [filamentous cyanobacterium CCT1]PSN81636.1 conjugative relaxase domain protein, TrwC/TraI family [filamentous cyanobacterium CCP4]
MLSMCSVSAAQAETYYEKDDYYTAGTDAARSTARWYGQGASTLGLQGEVKPEDFKALLHGTAPNGECLHARAIDPTRHRAATDYTFSAPKSVSIAGLVQGDERAIAAHNQAVDTALGVLQERFAQARVSTPEGRQRVVTGNIVAAVFQHDSSRELDPQLHSHCVVMNTTQLSDGAWRSLSNEEIVANQILLGEIYQNELAYQLRQFGYDIVPQGKGQFELNDYSPTLLSTFSTRTRQIETYLQQWQQSLEETQGTPLHASQKKQATLRTRKRKQAVPREVLLAAWQQQLSDQTLALPEVPHQERDLSTAAHYQADEMARLGTAHASERESVFRRGKVERFALEHALGEMPWATLSQAISAQGELLSVEATKDKYTTAAALHRERDTIQLMHQGQHQWAPILGDAELQEQLRQWPTLSAGQQRALTLALTSRDQMLAWQGLPGSGKTFVLQAFKQTAEAQGFSVRGFAPSAEAANVLGKEAGLPTDTVASLLHAPAPGPATEQREIWVVDEAGLLSAKDAHGLLSLAVEQQARVILVGDTRQLSAVEAGNPFKSLQAGGIQTAFLDESRRQKTAALKQAINLLATDQTEAAFQTLMGAGVIQTIPFPPARLQQVAIDYLAMGETERSKTLLLAGTNQERLALTALIRTGLQAQGQLSTDAFTLTSLRRKDMTQAQAGYAAHYASGDIVTLNQPYKRQGLVKQQPYQVIQVDARRNRLTLANEAGQMLEIDPMACPNKTVYTRQAIPVAVGDRLRWTRNDRTQNIRNGQAFTLTSIDAHGQAEIRYPDGRCDAVDLTGLQYVDYGLVSTTYSAQGKTADRVMALMDATTSQESFYVAVSRAKYQLSLYTADSDDLLRLAQRSSAKENVSDYIPLFNLVNTYGQTPESTPAAAPSTVGSRDAARDIGRGAGERVAAGLATAPAADRGAPAGQRPTALSDRDLSAPPGPIGGGAEADDHRTQPLPADLERIAQGARGWQQQRQLQAIAGTLIGLGDTVERVKSASEQQSRWAGALARLAHKLARGLERRRQQREQRERISAEQMMWAERLVPELKGILTLAKRAGQMEQTGPETWVLKGRHYTLSFCQATDTRSLVAQDGRGELLRLQRHQGAWQPQLAQGLTVEDVGQIQKAHRLLHQAMQAPQRSRQVEMER